MMLYYVQFHNGTFIFGAHGIGITGRGKTIIEAEARFMEKMGRRVAA